MMFTLGPNNQLTLKQFSTLMKGKVPLDISLEAVSRLDETRSFIDYLIAKNIKVYGLTTGFADLRDRAVPAEEAAELSRNLIASHDSGIGAALSKDVVLGAMIVRANSLSKGFSGFQTTSLQTLVDMINARIIPEIPCHGSLGASGDLALLARLGQAMQDTDVPVAYQGKTMSAKEALQLANIQPFFPTTKEGLALINGTSFMASMCAIGFLKEIHFLENLLALLPLFLESTGAVDAAFYSPSHLSRHQKGQQLVARLLMELLAHSPLIDKEGVQDDYSLRCIPQILGPKIEVILENAPRIEAELEAATDNPLLFRGNEISEDVHPGRLIEFQGANWLVVSGGNFHGEYLTTIADTIALANAKITLLLERHLTYMLNPFRNKQKLPPYLIHDNSKVGLHSGYMITQYTANDLAQKICYLGNPFGLYNITSANESEDVVSYGSSACQRLLTQATLLEDFMAIYLTVVSQAYSMKRQTANTFSERCFEIIQAHLPQLPSFKEESFSHRYNSAKALLQSEKLRELVQYPLSKQLSRPDALSIRHIKTNYAINNMNTRPLTQVHH